MKGLTFMRKRAGLILTTDVGCVRTFRQHDFVWLALSQIPFGNDAIWQGVFDSGFTWENTRI